MVEAAERTLSPEGAAFVVAQYLEFDPSYFLSQAALADMVIVTDGKKIHGFDLFGDCVTAKQKFLFSWMKQSGGGKALRELLLKRGLIGDIVAAD